MQVLFLLPPPLHLGTRLCIYVYTEVFRLVVRKNLKSADACAQIPSVFRALWCQEHHQNQCLVRICSISALRTLYLVRCGPWSSQRMQKNRERSRMRKWITDNQPENLCTAHLTCITSLKYRLTGVGKRCSNVRNDGHQQKKVCQQGAIRPSFTAVARAHIIQTRPTPRREPGDEANQPPSSDLLM